MNKDYLEELDEKIIKAHEQMESEILISHKLAEFKETRAIATAVEICDAILKEWEWNKNDN